MATNMATNLPPIEELFASADDDVSIASDDEQQRNNGEGNTNGASFDGRNSNALTLPAGPADQPAPVQLGGYVSPPGTHVYVQPRATVARSHLNGIKNASERRTGADPAGYVWVSNPADFIGFRRTKA